MTVQLKKIRNMCSSKCLIIILMMLISACTTESPKLSKREERRRKLDKCIKEYIDYDVDAEKALKICRALYSK